MAKLLTVVSSARTIRLADGSDHPTGYLVEGVLEPYEAFEAAGVDVVFASRRMRPGCPTWSSTGTSSQPRTRDQPTPPRTPCSSG
jgi:hypothetical protein